MVEFVLRMSGIRRLLDEIDASVQEAAARWNASMDAAFDVFDDEDEPRERHLRLVA